MGFHTSLGSSQLTLFCGCPVQLTRDSKLRDSLCPSGSLWRDLLSVFSPRQHLSRQRCPRPWWSRPHQALWEQALVPWAAPSVTLHVDCSRGVESHTTVLFAECGFYSFFFFLKKSLRFSWLSWLAGTQSWSEGYLCPTGKLRGTRLPGVPSCCTIVFPPVSPGKSWGELAPTVG